MLKQRATLALFYDDPPDSFFAQEEHDRFYDLSLEKDDVPAWAKTNTNAHADNMATGIKPWCHTSRYI